MAHFALLWKARTIEKYRQNYENEKYLSLQETNTPIPQKSLSQRLRCYRQDTQARFSRIFQKIYPEGSSLSHFFLNLKTDQTCLNFVFKSLLGFLTGLVLTYLCFLFLVYQLSISLFHATVISSVIGVLLTMGLAFSYRIRCLIFLLLPQFFSRAGRYTLTCYALVLILTGPATNTLKNSEVLTESMACRQEQIKTLVSEVKYTARKPLNSMRDSIKIMVQKIRFFTRQLKENLLKVNRLTLSVLETIHSTFLWLRWLSEACNKTMGTPYERCLKVLNEGVYKQKYKLSVTQMKSLVDKPEEICSNVKKYKAMCIFTDFVNGSFVATIKRRLKEFTQRIRDMLYLQIHVQHSYTFSSNISDSASQVAAGIVTEIRKRADPLLTWLSWSSCVTSLFLLLIIFRAKYYQHMFETRSRFDNKYITKELRDLDLTRLRLGRETILPLNRRERSKYVSTTSFRLVASEKIHVNRSIVFMTITTFKLLIHMVADYSLYWVLMTIQHNGKNQTPMPYGVPNAGMHITGTGGIADMFRSLLAALTSPLEMPLPLPFACLPNPNPPDFQRYIQIGGFMKFARRKLHRSYKYHSEEKYTFKKWLNIYIPSWLRYILRISKEEVQCLLCCTKELSDDLNTKLQKCVTKDCPGVYCADCFSDTGELCPICLSPSEYDDFSDVSYEKGSSDESDDDCDQGNAADENDEYIFDSENDDILLPKPLRDKNKYQNVINNCESNINSNKTTYIKNQISNMKTNLWIIDKIKTFSGRDISKYKYCIVSLSNENSVLGNNETTGKNKMASDNKTNNNDQKTIDNDKQVTKDVTNRKFGDKDSKPDGTNELNPNKSKDSNNKRKNKKSNLGQNELIKHETVTWCYFNRFNTLIFACWPNKKNNLFNACKSTSQTVINKNLSYDKNFKTRKKDKNIDKRIEDENARQYRIFSYLAEQDWVVKKTVTYKSTEEECSLVGEKNDNKTIKCLKNDILQRNIYLLDTEKERTLRRPLLEQHVFICDRCRFHCLCPGNPLNQLLRPPCRSLPTSEHELLKEKDSKPAITTSKSKENIAKTPSKSISKRKRSFMSRMIRCLKSSCRVKKKKKVEEIQMKKQDQATSTQHVQICTVTKKICRKQPKCCATQYETTNDLTIIKREGTLTEDKSVLIDQKEVQKKCKDKCISTEQKELQKKTKDKSVSIGLKDVRKKTKDKCVLIEQRELVNMIDEEIQKELPVKDNAIDLEPIKQTEPIRNKCCNGKGKSQEKKKNIDTETQKKLPSRENSIELELQEISNKYKKDKNNCKGQKTKKNIDSEIQKDSSVEKKNFESKRKEVSNKIKSDKCKSKAIKNKKKIDEEKKDKLERTDVTNKCTQCNKRKHKESNAKNKIEIKREKERSPKENKTEPHKQICANCKGDAELCKQEKLHKKCDDLCPDECKCNNRGVMIEKCDPLCPEECECHGEGVQFEPCDPLCPEDCTCGGQGIEVEKCDPLCPKTCKCDGHGITVKTCDPLCPTTCTCDGHGIVVRKCDPQCPKTCTCNGHGITEERNYLCSGDCCCKDAGIETQQELSAPETTTTSEEECSHQSTNNSCCSLCGDNKKTCPNCRNKTTTSDTKVNSSIFRCTDSNKSKKGENKRRSKQSKKPKLTRVDDTSRNCDKIKLGNRSDSSDEIECCPLSECASCVNSDSSMTPGEMYCSCAIQCPPLHRPNKITKQYFNGIEDDDPDSSSLCTCCCSDAKRNDFTGAHNTVRHCYVERPRMRRVNRTIVNQRNQCIGTNIEPRCDVGTMTKEKGLIRKNVVYVPKTHGICWDRIYKRDIGVSTKKTVSFRSRVQLIPSDIFVDDFLDIYTPSRYLLESQKYYNDIYAGANIYPIKFNQKWSHERSSYGSRSYSYRRGRRAKRLDGYLQQKYLTVKRVNTMLNGANRAKYRKSQKEILS
ncbi:uncharacterized protein LOC128680350 isoform X2 [Plodia interpunctella]|uniref:uncharacterized protein LOC128680350 isoform X2 n=1 Tax=Plodia interpunctella TaxID=58824 RepID=UPI002368E261|nr:uncharacterized protein LOC128680350 isoform X2 [Plodia interpunctella]